MTRKATKGIGGEADHETPIDPAGAYTSVLFVERILKELLNQTTGDLVADPTEARRFFDAWFDTTLTTKELDSFVNYFIKSPPLAQLGYARLGADLPILAIVLTDENEDTPLLGDYVGGSEDGSEGLEHTGTIFDATYTIFVYAENPDACAILYQYTKAVVHAGKTFLFSCGVIEASLSGGELAPDENYMPENMFVRALRVKAKHPFSSPRVKPFDPRRVQVTGIFGSDVVVEGQTGGVHAVVEIED